MTERHAVAAGTLFDGSRLHCDCAVLIESGRILGIVPRGQVPAAMPLSVLPERAWLAPALLAPRVVALTSSLPF